MSDRDLHLAARWDNARRFAATADRALVDAFLHQAAEVIVNAEDDSHHAMCQGVEFVLREDTDVGVDVDGHGIGLGRIMGAE